MRLVQQNLVHLSCMLALVALRTTAAAAGDAKTISEALNPKPNYSWAATVLPPENSGMRPMTVEGKAGREGPSAVTLRFGDRTIQGYLKGNKAYVTSPDTNWKSIPEMETGESPGQFMHRMVRSVTPPAKQIAELAGVATN